jgi:hypothetical protein
MVWRMGDTSRGFDAEGLRGSGIGRELDKNDLLINNPWYQHDHQISSELGRPRTPRKNPAILANDAVQDGGRVLGGRVDMLKQ